MAIACHEGFNLDAINRMLYAALPGVSLHWQQDWLTHRITWCAFFVGGVKFITDTPMEAIRLALAHGRLTGDYLFTGAFDGERFLKHVEDEWKNSELYAYR